jgi:hypothetical protein
MQQITTFSVFRVEGFQNKWWAFKQMQIGIRTLKKVEGLLFYKLLGSGGKKGFSIFPNFGTYVLLGVWRSETDARQFILNSPYYNAYISKSIEHFNIFLKSAEAHGKWNGIQPFEPGKKIKDNQAVLVLTRATIRFSKLISFWRKVESVSQSLGDYDGLAFSIGVGEWPLIQQATLSLWNTQEEMLHFAYKNPKHREMVLINKKMKWFSEELFARFTPYKIEGQWNNQDASLLIKNANSIKIKSSD